MTSVPRYTLGCCVWGRHKLTDLIYDYYARLRAEVADVVDLTLLAVGSEYRGDAALTRGWSYREADNQPLGAKHNMLAEHVYRTGTRGLIVIGSDDLVSAGWVRQCVADLEAGADVVGLLGLAFLDLDSGGTALYSREGDKDRLMPAGVGRGLSRRALDSASSWQPWPAGLARGLDTASYRRVLARLPDARVVRHWPNAELAAVDIKGGGMNLNNYSSIARKLKLDPLPVGWLEARFGAEVVRALVRLRLCMEAHA